MLPARFTETNVGDMFIGKYMLKIIQGQYNKNCIHLFSIFCEGNKIHTLI